MNPTYIDIQKNLQATSTLVIPIGTETQTKTTFNFRQKKVVKS